MGSLGHIDDVDIGIVAQALNEYGTVTISGISTDAQLIQLADDLGTIVRPSESDANGITHITASDPNQRERLDFTRETIEPHSDGSGQVAPPNVLALWNVKQAEHGGQSYLADMRAVYANIAGSDPALLAILGHPAYAVFGHGDRGPAPVFEQHDGLIRARFRDDNGLQTKHTAAQQALRGYVDRHMVPAPNEEGAVRLVNNVFMAHGRLGYDGDRLIKRVQVQSPLVTPGFAAPGYQK